MTSSTFALKKPTPDKDKSKGLAQNSKANVDLPLATPVYPSLSSSSAGYSQLKDEQKSLYPVLDEVAHQRKTAAMNKFAALQGALVSLRPAHSEGQSAVPSADDDENKRNNDFIEHEHVEKFIQDEEVHGQMNFMLDKLTEYHQVYVARTQRAGAARFDNEKQILDTHQAILVDQFAKIKTLMRDASADLQKDPKKYKTAIKEQMQFIGTMLSHGASMLVANTLEEQQKHAAAMKKASDDFNKLPWHQDKRVRYVAAAFLVLVGLILIAKAPLVTGALIAIGGLAAYRNYKSVEQNKKIIHPAEEINQLHELVGKSNRGPSAA